MTVTHAAGRRRSAERTFRGYRLQLLYTLWRCLAGPPGSSIRLEGFEDLDVFDSDGVLIEAIQVKAYNAPLSLSDVQDAQTGPTSLRERLAVLRASYPAARIKISSYSGFGPELAAFCAGDVEARRRVSAKVGSVGADIDLASVVELEHCHEQAIAERIAEDVAAGIAGADVATSTELMLYWLFQQSEIRATVTRDSVLERLLQVGRFVSGRLAHASEWFTSIRPLTSAAESNALEVLREQFDNGVNVRLEHVVAGLDVARPERLDSVVKGFEKGNVVIIHGASGQGKSCLAYRYMHDYVPHALGYEIRRIADLPQAQRMVLALTEHARQCTTPICVYIDVHPGDSQWSTLLEELATVPLVRILVGIREEDWRRGRPIGASTMFYDVALAFDESEARQLFERCLDRDQRAFVDFDEAWRYFGGSGPLLEFTYFLTHHDTLRARLAQQVATLCSELDSKELSFLAAVLTASEFGCSLDVRRISAAAQLEHPLATLDRLEREYLVRVADDPGRVEGLHAVRSQIALDLVCDGAIVTWTTAAERALVALPDDAVETFLFQALVRRRGAADILICASKASHSTWTSVAGVLRALLWHSIRDHITQCAELIPEAREMVPGIWRLMFFGNVVGLPGRDKDPFIDLMTRVSPETVPKVQNLKARLPLCNFDAVKSYIGVARSGVSSPQKLSDWIGIAEFIFWAYFWKLPYADDLLAGIDLGAAAALPVPVALSLLRALGDSPASSVVEFRAQIEQRFRDEFEVLRIERADRQIRSDFVIRNALGVKVGTEAHNEALLQVEALRCLDPHSESFGCVGHGGLTIGDYDDTHKAGMPRDAFYPHWGVHCNRIAGNLAEYGHRSQTWTDYFEQCDMRRRIAIGALGRVAALVEEHFATLRPFADFSFLDEFNLWSRLLLLDVLLPISAVDPWGFATESDRLDSSNTRALGASAHAGEVVLAAAVDPLMFAKGSAENQTARNRSLGTVPQAPWIYGEHVKRLKGYLASVGALMNTVGEAIGYGNRTTRGVQKHRQVAKLMLKSKSTETVRAQSAHLLGELAAMQRAMQSDLGGRMDTPESVELQAAEQQAVRRLWALWQLFCDSTANKIPNAFAVAEQRIDDWLTSKLDGFVDALSVVSSAKVRAVLRRRSDQLAAELWILIDAESRQAFEALVGVVENAIEGELRDESKMARAIYSEFLNEIYIIPIFWGYAISGMAIRCNALALCVPTPSSYRFTRLESEVLRSAGIHLVVNGAISKFEACVAAWSNLAVLYARAQGVISAPVDAYGTVVRTAVLSRLEGEWTCVVDNAIDATNAAIGELIASEYDTFAGIPSLSAVLGAYADTKQDLLMNPAWVGDAAEYATQISGLVSHLGNLYFDLVVGCARAASRTEQRVDVK